MADGEQHLHVASPHTDMGQHIWGVRGEHCYCPLRYLLLPSHALRHQHCWLIVHLHKNKPGGRIQGLAFQQFCWNLLSWLVTCVDQHYTFNAVVVPVNLATPCLCQELVYCYANCPVRQGCRSVLHGNASAWLLYAPCCKSPPAEQLLTSAAAADTSTPYQLTEVCLCICSNVVWFVLPKILFPLESRLSLRSDNCSL